MQRYFATCGRGIEPVLADELRVLCAADVAVGRGGVAFAGDKAPGQNKGNGINASGGLWWEMTVNGSTPSPSAAGGGGGY